MGGRFSYIQNLFHHRDSRYLKWKTDSDDRNGITMKNQKKILIIMVVGIIAVFFVILSLSGFFPKGMMGESKSPENLTPGFIDRNLSVNKLPPEIKAEVQKNNKGITPLKWEFNSTNNDVINLYVTDIRNESVINVLQEKKIGDYTLRVINDREFETIRSEIKEYLNELQKNPEYQIRSTELVQDPDGPYAILWCYKSTPENQKLDKTTIKGWKIFVYVESLPPTATTTNPVK